MRCCRLLARSSGVNIAHVRSTIQELLAREHHFGKEMMLSVNFTSEPYVVPNTVDSIAFPFKVRHEGTDTSGGLHVGMMSALADVYTTLHLWGVAPAQKHVSVDFNVVVHQPLLPAHDAEMITRVSKFGKRLAFTEFRVVDRADPSIVFASGTHTKAIL